MAHKSLRQIRAELRQLRTDQFVAAKLEVQAPDGETLFTVGGWWNRLSHRFVERDVECPARVVKLKKSQVTMGRAIGKYIAQRLAGDDERVALMLAIGDRGGGKTFLLGGVLMVAVALALPGTYQMAVSITAKQNREIKQAIAQVAGAESKWVTDDITDFRDPYTEFVTGSKILWRTSKNPKALRDAGLPYEHALVNEGQDQREAIFTNVMSAIRRGGVVTVATNPPQEASGDWVAVLHQGIEAGEKKDAIAFELEAKDNDAVSQSTLGKIERLIRMVNPAAADADSLGIIKLSGNVGYPGFTRLLREHDEQGRWLRGHIGEPILLGPYAWRDVTREITAEHTHADDGFDYVAGGDFQTDPGCCAPVGKLYQIPTGQVLLWIREFVGASGTEGELTAALNARGYYPGPIDYEGRPAASCLIVGDATGARQNAEHRKRDPYSYTRLRAEGGWTILSPFLLRNRTGGTTPMNPLVEESRKQMRRLHETGLLVYSPRCAETSAPFPSLIESLARAKVNAAGKFEKKGHYTHGPDGLRYLARRFLPWGVRPDEPTEIDTDAFNELRSVKLL